MTAGERERERERERGGEGIKEKEEGRGKRRDRGGGEGARAGMKCSSAIKLSEPLTFSYKGAYLPLEWLLV